MAKNGLLMISAMNENGGNTFHRHLDSHPELFVYPFESQLGTRTVSDYLASVFPQKYRWPAFPLSGNFSNDYDLIWDEEMKVRINTPKVSKFQSFEFEVTDKKRKEIFLNLLKGKKRTTKNIVEAFFASTFRAWKSRKSSHKEHIYAGYSPIIAIDSEKIINDFPDAKIIQIVRNPFSSYADTKYRPVPLTLNRYIQSWNIVQMMSISYQKKFAKNVFIYRLEDLFENKKKFFERFCIDIGIKYNESLLYPSWNGVKLKNLYPWGHVLLANSDYNRNRAKELSKTERNEIASLASQFIDYFDYKSFTK